MTSPGGTDIENPETTRAAADREFREMFPPGSVSFSELLSLLTKEELELIFRDDYRATAGERAGWRRRLVERARLVREAERGLDEAMT